MDPLSIYKRVDSENSVLLHSSRNDSKERYSIIAFDPFLVYESKKNENPFEQLKKLLTEHKATKRSNNSIFDGIAIGYFGYGSVYFIEQLPRNAIDDLRIPNAKFAFYKDYFIFDHSTNKLILVGDKNKLNKALERKPKQIPNSGKTEKPKSNFTKQDYCKAVEKVKEYIKSGDTFQVNISQRFETETTIDPLFVYEKLSKINPSNFGAYLNFGDLGLLSSSPERLVKLTNGKAWTRPIAGTRPRGRTKEEDQALEKELKTNEKELAEHTMLVDLERNDLGKVCEYGTVKVDEIMTIERYSHVMHLVSEVSGQLRKDRTNVDLLKAMFPGGTITGCPKVRTMEITDEIEPTQRGPYTGAIGYFSLSGDMDFNMTIRTILMKGKKVYLQVGGGIVYDSVPEKEYDETIHKANAMFKALGIAEDEATKK
ncbi:MAG: aminodeoxychorismate synthase component I [Candidatus Micrarchaeota archaeon]